MTDKQIIIDGVDVSKCSYFDFTGERYCYECSSEFGCAICDERPNCLYKQLARKEQECEDWKNRSDGWMSKCEQETKLREFIEEQLNQLKQALAEIKEIAETTVKPNLIKRMNGMAKYGIDKIIELTEVKNDR